jgi:hypothetical protein
VTRAPSTGRLAPARSRASNCSSPRRRPHRLLLTRSSGDRPVHLPRARRRWFVDIGDGGGVGRSPSVGSGMAAIGDPLRAMGARGSAPLDPRSVHRAHAVRCSGGRDVRRARRCSPLLMTSGRPTRCSWAARDREGTTDDRMRRGPAHNAQSHNHNDVGNAAAFVCAAVRGRAPTHTAQTAAASATTSGDAVRLPQPADHGQMQKHGPRSARRTSCWRRRMPPAHDEHRAAYFKPPASTSGRDGAGTGRGSRLSDTFT